MPYEVIHKNRVLSLAAKVNGQSQKKTLISFGLFRFAVAIDALGIGGDGGEDYPAGDGVSDGLGVAVAVAPGEGAFRMPSGWVTVTSSFLLITNV